MTPPPPPAGPDPGPAPAPPDDLPHLAEVLTLWPGSIVEATLADRNRLFDVIDRADEALAHAGPDGVDPATAIAAARAILAEATPTDDEPEAPPR